MSTNFINDVFNFSSNKTALAELSIFALNALTLLDI